MCSKNAKIRGFLFYFNLQQNLLHTLEAFSYRNVLYSKYCTKRLFFVLKRRGNKKYKYKLNGSKMAVPPAAHRRFCLYRFLICTAPQAQSLSKTAVIYFQLAFYRLASQATVYIRKYIKHRIFCNTYVLCNTFFSGAKIKFFS